MIYPRGCWGSGSRVSHMWGGVTVGPLLGRVRPIITSSLSRWWPHYGLLGLSRVPLIDAAHDPPMLAMFCGGVHGHRRHHPHRRHGGTLEVRVVSRLRLLHVDAALSALRQLGLGRRVSRLPRRESRPRTRRGRFCRLFGRAHDRRRDGPRRRHRPRAAHRQVSSRRNDRRDARPQPASGVARISGARVRLVRLQRRLHARRFRSAHRRDRRQHPAASAAGAIALSFVWQRHRRPDIAMACNGLLAAQQSPGCVFCHARSGGAHRRRGGPAWSSSVGILERRFRIDDPVGAIAARVCGTWGTLAVGSSPTEATASTGTASRARFGLLSWRCESVVAQVVGIAVNVSLSFSARRMVSSG